MYFLQLSAKLISTAPAFGGASSTRATPLRTPVIIVIARASHPHTQRQPHSPSHEFS
jgi:hypothetical protein